MDRVLFEQVLLLSALVMAAIGGYYCGVLEQSKHKREYRLLRKELLEYIVKGKYDI